MGAVPKRKITSRRRKNRRAHTYAAPTLPNLVPCPNCGEPIRPYHACPYCGYYRGKQVIEIEE